MKAGEGQRYNIDRNGQCRHIRMRAIGGKWDECQDCGTRIYRAHGDCQHDYVAWGSDPRYERCRYCQAVRVVAVVRQPDE